MTRTYTSWFERYAAVCKQLRDLFVDEDRKPMIVFERAGGLVAFRIGENGHVYRVHKAIGWIAHKGADEGRFIESGDAPIPPECAFIGEEEHNEPDAVETAIREAYENTVQRDNERLSRSVKR